jgi:integrase
MTKNKEVLKHEKNIYERTNRRGPYLQVKIQVMKEDKMVYKSFGVFQYADYPSNKDCMNQAIECRNKALEEIKENRVVFTALTVDDCFQASKDLLLDSIKTKKKHNFTYNRLIPKELRNTDITKVTTEQVKQTINTYAKGHSHDSVKNAKTVWHQIFQTAAMKEIPVIDRTTLFKLPKSKYVPEKRDLRCTHEDIHDFLPYLLKYGAGYKKSTQRVKCLWYGIQIMEYEGLRPQETFALHRSDIDLKTMTIRIIHSVGSDAEDIRKIITNKTEESERTVTIDIRLKPILEDLLKWSKTEILFLDTDGLPFDIDVLCSTMCNVRKKYKDAPRITLYMGRHLFATEKYNDKKNNPKAVQHIMGHVSEATTLGYLTTTEDEEKNVINRMS